MLQDAHVPRDNENFLLPKCPLEAFLQSKQNFLCFLPIFRQHSVNHDLVVVDYFAHTPNALIRLREKGKTIEMPKKVFLKILKLFGFRLDRRRCSRGEQKCHILSPAITPSRARVSPSLLSSANLTRARRKARTASSEMT